MPRLEAMAPNGCCVTSVKMHSSDAIFSWNKKTTLFGVISLALQPSFSCKSVNLDIFYR